jgi:hypothetical protein
LDPDPKLGGKWDPDPDPKKNSYGSTTLGSRTHMKAMRGTILKNEYIDPNLKSKKNCGSESEKN